MTDPSPHRGPRRGKRAGGVASLRARLDEAEETLRAIRAGEVDAIVGAGAAGGRVFTLEGAEHPYRLMVEAMSEGAVTLAVNGVVLYCNQHFAKLVGVELGRVIGSRIQAFVAPGDARGLDVLIEAAGTRTARGRIEFRRSDGTPVPSYVAMRSLRANGVESIVTVVTDLTELVRTKAFAEHISHHDALTNLANRDAFAEALERAVVDARRSAVSFAVLHLDLDHFKDINDTLGHQAGDLLLLAAADRLQATIGRGDTLARFGGDEFAIIQAVVRDPRDAVALAEAALKAISDPFSIQGRKVHIGTSVGVAVFGPDSVSAEALLSHADLALSQAKSDGRGVHRLFTEAMDAEIRTRVTLAAELRDAITFGQLFLVYQPQVDVATGVITGLEALVRWRHPARGLISPGVFIPIAEKSGLIVGVGYWVLYEACRQMKEWLDTGIAPSQIGVNLSGLQFKAPLELEASILRTLEECALPPRYLELEITESVLMETSRQTNDVLLRLRKAGVRLALDDFGTGYSSYEYLSRFPVDRIKIAPNFVAGLEVASADAAIVKSTIGLGRELRLNVVVEGIETAEQLARVKSWGCHEVQGYYYSKPLPAAEAARLLRGRKIEPPKRAPTPKA